MRQALVRAAAVLLGPEFAKKFELPGVGGALHRLPDAAVTLKGEADM